MLLLNLHSVMVGAIGTAVLFVLWYLASRPVCHVRIFFRDRTGAKKRYDVTFAGAKESGFIPINLMEKVLVEAGFGGSTLDGVSMFYSREIITKNTVQI